LEARTGSDEEQGGPALRPSSADRQTKAKLERSNGAIYHTSDDLVPFVQTGKIYIEFDGSLSEAEKAEVLARHRLAIARVDDDETVTASVASLSDDAVVICASLQGERGIRLAEPGLTTDGELKQFTLPVDALSGNQWHLENRGSINGEPRGLKAGADARVVAAWRLLQGYGSPNVVIGIIDDGFDLTHPDLADRARHPWNFARNDGNVGPEHSVISPTIGNWHGTACAGIAIGSLGAGNIVGAAPGCSWIPVKWKPRLDPEDVARWFDYMREKGAWIISCSWAARAQNYPLLTPIAKAIRRCAKEGRGGKGCVVVFAAGNEDRDVNDPGHQSVNGFANHPDVIAVAASTSTDQRAHYSNFGKSIHVCAPSSGLGGIDITTADVTGQFVDITGTPRHKGYAPGDYNEHFGKTSSACPLVAGICGLMLSANPFLTAQEVHDILKSTARRIGERTDYDADGHSIHFGYGCANAEAAVSVALSMIPTS
jgi:subtilisin family serine protease